MAPFGMLSGAASPREKSGYAPISPWKAKRHAVSVMMKKYAAAAYRLPFRNCPVAMMAFKLFGFALGWPQCSLQACRC